MAFAGPYPDALPPAAALHASALAGHRPAELLRALEAAPVRERMVALGIAFSLDLRALGLRSYLAVPLRLRELRRELGRGGMGVVFAAEASGAKPAAPRCCATRTWSTCSTSASTTPPASPSSCRWA